MNDRVTWTVMEERVERGAEWLDANLDEWWTLIELTSLDMKNSCACVLGQTLGWGNGQDRLAATFHMKQVSQIYEAHIEHGFDAEADEFEQLQALWETEISKRSGIDV